MDSESNLPKPELPKPTPNTGENIGEGYESFGSVSPELHVQPMPGEKMAQASSAVAQAVSDVTQTQGPVTNATDDDQTNSPVIADDSDVIEKEWVDKAKNIVAKTQGDPHAKSKELTYLKKDYMQKRYGKMIKTPNDNSVAV